VELNLHPLWNVCPAVTSVTGLVPSESIKAGETNLLLILMSPLCAIVDQKQFR